MSCGLEKIGEESVMKKCLALPKVEQELQDVNGEINGMAKMMSEDIEIIFFEQEGLQWQCSLGNDQ